MSYANKITDLSDDDYFDKFFVGDYEGANPVIHGENQSGDIIRTRGWIANGKTVLKRTNRFHVENVYSRTPWSFLIGGELNRPQVFVVMEDVVAHSDTLEIKITPPICEEKDNLIYWVDEFPRDGAKLIIWGEPNQQYKICLPTF